MAAVAGRPRARIPKPHQIALAALLTTYVAFALAYSVNVPIGETPDEIGHVQFVQYVAEHHRLPIQELKPNNEVGEGHQAPLYYLIAGLATTWVDASDLTTFRANPALSFAADGSKNKNAMIHTLGERWPYTGYVLEWHIARLVSVICGLIAVILSYRVGLLALGGDQALALTAGAVMGFNPGFLFANGAASNDALAAALGTAVLLASVVLVIGGRVTVARSAGLGCLSGLAMLTKLTLAAPVGVSVGILLYRAARSRKKPIQLVLAWSVAAGVTSGWWFVRNLYLYGDLLALNVDRAQNPSLVYNGPPDLALVRKLLTVARDSYFARFGWMNVNPPTEVYGWLTALVVLTAVGLLVVFLRAFHSGSSTPVNLRALALCIIFVAALLTSQLVVAATKGPSAYQGRYLFPIASAIAVAMVAGLAQIVGFRARRFFALLLAGAWMAFSAYSLLWVIVPAYSAPLPVFQPSKTIHPSMSVGAQVGEQFELLGYDADKGFWRSGGRGSITLYWQDRERAAIDDTVFVQLIDRQGHIVAQSDSMPANRQYPTSRWQPNEKIMDRHDLDLSFVAAGTYSLYVGMYNLADMKRLPVQLPSGTTLDHWETSWVINPG